MTSGGSIRPPDLRRTGREWLIERHQLILGSLFLFAAALSVRLWELGVPDLSQAEHHKLAAVADWRDGNFIVDGEHPALLKAAVLASTALINDDTVALRLPNAIAGAAIAVVVMLIGRRLAGAAAGWTAGALMALGTLPVAVDRVGKEDTLMLFFALAAVLAWLTADRPARWLLVAGCAAAAAAAKYQALPLLPALWLAGRLGLGPAPPALNCRRLALTAAVFFGVHFALNPFILAPSQWAFLWEFTGSLSQGQAPADGTIVPTTGFAAAGELFANKPFWYYGLYLGLKAQLVWVVLVASGLVFAVWRRERTDVLLLVWAVPYVVAISLVPFGFARYLAPVLPALALLGGVAVASAARRVARPAVTAGAVVLIAALLLPLFRILPFPSMYVSTVGGGSERALHWTPDDAIGNLGMAEAVDALEGLGLDGRVAVADPTLVSFLSEGRLTAVPVENVPPRPAELTERGIAAVILQPSQLSAGNARLFAWLQSSGSATTTIRVEGIATVEIYVLGPDGRPR